MKCGLCGGKGVVVVPKLCDGRLVKMEDMVCPACKGEGKICKQQSRCSENY